MARALTSDEIAKLLKADKTTASVSRTPSDPSEGASVSVMPEASDAVEPSTGSSLSEPFVRRSAEGDVLDPVELKWCEFCQGHYNFKYHFGEKGGE